MSVDALLLQREIEQFLFAEAALIDDQRFAEWLDLLHEDFRLFTPITRNVRYDRLGSERTREKQDICWFDEGKDTVAQRVAQIATGLHWAEEPRSRTTHLITNVRMTDISPDIAGVQSVTAASAFLLYRNRVHVEADYLIGRRIDVLCRAGDSWKVLRREVNLAQSVLLAKNLTSFF